MFLRRIMMTVLLMSHIGLASAAASLELPEHLELLSINGLSTSGNLLNRTRSYTLPDGEAVLELRYADLVEAEIGDSHSNYRSQPVAIRFHAEDKRRYALRAERPLTESAARKFAAAPTMRVESLDGKPAPSQQFVDHVDLKNGVLSALTRTVAPQAIAVTPAKETGPASGQAERSSLAGQNLWYWWQQADEPTRRRFLEQVGR